MLTLEEITPDMALPHNLFADMGLPNADIRFAKAQMAILIEQRIEELGLNQKEAAQRMGMHQPEVSKIVRGINSGFSLERMVEALQALGNNIAIVVHQGAKDKRHGMMQVVSAGAYQELQWINLQEQKKPAKPRSRRSPNALTPVLAPKNATET
jgi:predicted XRE-type DNA-binding protein